MHFSKKKTEKKQHWFEVQVNKSHKTPFWTLGKKWGSHVDNKVIWSKPLTESGEIKYKTAWLDKILHKQHYTHRACAQGSGRSTGQNRRLTLEKRQPCFDTAVLAKARCSEDKKHAGDKKKPRSTSRVSSLIIILQRFSHMSQTLAHNSEVALLRCYR